MGVGRCLDALLFDETAVPKLGLGAASQMKCAGPAKSCLLQPPLQFPGVLRFAVEHGQIKLFVTLQI